MKTTKILAYLGLLGTILVGLGEYYLHYSENVLEQAANYEFFKSVSLANLKTGHFLAVFGLAFYFAGYLHVYRMLRGGNELLARIVTALGFMAFAVGGIWIGSRGFIGTIVHLQERIEPDVYEIILTNYTDLLEILVKALRVIIALLSIFFVVAILKGQTHYRKWMAIFNPVLILGVVFSTLFFSDAIAQHLTPVAMNVTHFILFGMSLYQLHLYEKETKPLIR